jgi:hypothetical protein
MKRIVDSPFAVLAIPTFYLHDESARQESTSRTVEVSFDEISPATNGG